MLLSKKLLFYQNLFPKEFYTPGHYQTYMIPGTYYVITRSAGGAGGENGGNGSWSGGVGGAGGYGEITSQIITVKDFTVADVYVGAGGKLRANSGNGGAGGSPAGSGKSGGNGGGGGEPSYVVINSYLVSAEAGGGGGGGGGCAGGPGRRAGGGAGGGGGGYYKLGTSNANILRTINIHYYEIFEEEVNGFAIEPLMDGVQDIAYVEIPANEEIYVGKVFSRTSTYTDTSFGVTMNCVTTATVKEIKNNGNVVFNCSEAIESIAPVTKDLEVENISSQGTITIVSVDGKTGGTGANYYQYGSAGQNGRTTDGGNLITAGRGGGGNHYQTGAGGAGGTGFGASGGGGNAGDKNDHTHGDSKGGFGGGGAGGSITAAGGGITVQDWGTVATAGYNHFTTPVDTTEENAEYGITGNYGTGGTTATEGQGGCVIIRLVNTATEFIDLGDVVTSVPTTIDNAGTITGETEESDDAGTITGTVESSDDAGLIYEPTSATPWALGLITEAVTETKNCGNIM